MGRLKKRSTIANPLSIVGVFLVCLLYSNRAEAAFATQFSFTAGELYTDNLFFTKQKDHDFVTTLTPTFSILYAPEGSEIPTLNLNISPAGSIFARHSELNNFGDNWSLSGGYTYPYTDKLNFHASDVLSRQGSYNLGPITQGAFQLPSLPTTPPPVGAPIPGQGNQNLSNFNSAGSQINNNFSLGAAYLYRPDISFNADYTNNFVRYIDLGGTDIYQTIGFRGVYNWRLNHNLHAGYWLSIYKTRNQGTQVINNFDFGDDYFNNLEFQITPTLSLTASTGLSINTSSSGPGVSNNSTLTITKVWERAQAFATVQHGLTPSYGVGSISETTTFNAGFNMLLTERLSAIAGVDFPLYNTDEGSFKTFQASAGLQYRINSWLTSNLFYSYRMSDASTSAARNSDGILQAGRVSANSAYINLTSTFDIWPNFGLSRGFGPSSSLSPIIRTPFSVGTPTAPSSAPSSPGSTSPSSSPGTSNRP